MRERRGHPRLQEEISVSCHPPGDPSAGERSAVILNLGTGGMRLRGAAALPSDTMLEGSLQPSDASEPVTFQGRVAWSSMQASGVVESGVEFRELTASQQAQLSRLLVWLAEQP